MISFPCSHCGRGLKAKDDLADRSLRCPNCQQRVTVPGVAPGEYQTIPAPPLPEDQATLPPSDAGPGQGVEADLVACLAPPQAPGEIGRLGGYSVLAVLGAGGMGVVFKAHDPQLHRLVALKAMLPSVGGNGSNRERFLREARAAAAVKHDHIVTIHQVGEDRRIPFLAMELLDGEPLHQRLEREGKLPVPEILRIGQEIALGLAAAHDKGLVHRDIKPANVWLEALAPLAPGGRGVGGEGRRYRVKILDFGLARAVREEQQLTQQGAIVGTPAFMSPEQAQSLPVDARTDLFSLGCILYCACTGQAPFRGRDTIATLMAVVGDDPPPPHQVDRRIPAALSRLVMQLLAKTPAGRPASAAAVAETLAEIAADRTEQVPPLRRPSPRARGKRRLLLGGAVLGVLAVAVTAGVLLSRPGRDDDPGKGGTPPEDPPGKVVLGTPGKPLSPAALVREPAGLPRVLGWTIETRHPRRLIRALAFHPSDGSLATAGDDGTIRVYDARTGELRRAILAEQQAGRNEGIRALAWSIDGKFLASAGADQKVRLWDTATGRLVQPFEIHSGAVNCLAWMPDGKVLGAGDDSGRVNFWEPATGKRLPEINPRIGPIHSLDWSAGGRWGAVSGPAGAYTTRDVCVWTWGGVRYQTFRGSASPAWGTSPETRWVLAYKAGADKVRFWDAEKRQGAGEFKAHSHHTWAVKQSPTGKMLASAGTDNLHRSETNSHVRIWSLPDHKRLHDWNAALFRGEQPPVPLTWSPDGKTVAYVGMQAIHLRDVGPNWSLDIPQHATRKTGSSLSPDRTALATLHDSAVNIWDIPESRWRKGVKTGTVGLQSVDWSPGGLAVTGHREGNPFTMVLVLPSGKRTGYWGDGDGRLQAWSPTGDFLLLRRGDAKGTGGLVVFRPANLKQPLPGRPALAANGPLVWSPDGKSVAGRAANRPDVVRLWAVPEGEGQFLEGHQAPTRALAFSPKGDLLASGSNDSTIRLWDLKGARKFEPLKGHTGPVVGLYWTLDGTALASTGEDGTLRIWESATGKLRPFLIKGSELLGPVAWSADGKRVAAKQGGHLRIWDARTGKELQEFATGVRLDLLAWGPRDEVLVAARADGRVDLWDPTTGKLRCTLVNLRGEQWLVVSPEGHYDGPPDIERELVYVVQSENGQKTLTPQQFAEKYGWKNNPQRVRTAP
jgi:WD40 repeat protein/serine/threonine protein kinase/DNA-directed RNA polymerase subunit RPC12/RpoP